MSHITDLSGQKDLPRYFGRVFEVLQNIKEGRLEVHLPDGRAFVADSGVDGPDATLVVRNPGLFARILRDGETGFGEAYMDGWWDSPDLCALLDLFLLSNKEVGHNLPALALVRSYERMRHWLRGNSKAQARRNISAHYDLGNEFYAAWLDPSMTYSSALYQGDDSLPEAQDRKYAGICEKIGLKPDAHVLEIGCGWGGFAEHAARQGAKVTGLTISREQHDYAKKRLFEAGLAERVDIVMRDYRDEEGRYDGIASIEMFEAVGEKYWPTYFGALRDRLKDGASAGLQVITVADDLFDGYRKRVDFVQKYIFPGGMLPSISALRARSSESGLSETSLTAFGESYSRTLRKWYADFNAAWDRIEPMGFDDRFRRMWNYYLAACAATFRAQTTDVIQIGLVRR